MLETRISVVHAVRSVSTHKMLNHHAVFAARLHACCSGPAAPALRRKATQRSRGQDGALSRVEGLQERGRPSRCGCLCLLQNGAAGSKNTRQ